ncbi:HtaA domain-containing protein [Curtobacterium sp. 24E2]|nr:HtaA domain-containing protein [Curtobacterium sp. 24E2]
MDRDQPVARLRRFGRQRLDRLPEGRGGTSTPTFATKCQTGDGATVRPGTTTAGVLTLAAGTGTVDAAGGTADIAWDGGFTVAFYGGLTYWSAEDPELHVAADGTGELTATVSGYAASRDGGSWAPLTPRTVHLATLTDVDVTSSGITVSPDWQGVEPASATSLNKTNADWGSWPADFVDFQNETGQSSYWYTSGANDAAAKKPQPISIAYTAAEAPTPEPTTPVTPEPTTEPSEPGTPEPTTEPSEPGTPEPTTGPTTPAPSISTGGTTTFTVGDSVPLRAEGLPAATEYSIVLHSDPVVLGRVTTDADGAFATSVAIPADTPAGAHTIAVESSDGTAVVSLAITVSADGTVVVDPVDTTTAVTTGAAVNTGGTVSGTSALPWIGLSAVGVVALGSVAFMAYRRRVTQQD